MINRNSAYCLFAILILLSISCGKEDGPPPPPVDPPRGNDSLGIGWQKIPMPDSLYFQDVFFVNDRVGYIAGNNYLAKSIDGGLTWTQLNMQGNEQGYSNLYFTDALHGCAVGGGVVWTTKNGGQSWEGKGGLSILIDAQFISATEGYLCGSNGLYKTIDGGINWTKVPSITGEISALFFMNNNLGWVALRNQVRKTDDALNSFGTAVNATISANSIYAMQFTDNNHGWAASFNTNIIRTLNGGNSWEEIVKDGHSDIHFFDNNNGFLFSGSNIYRTNDGGTTLIKQAVIRKSDIIEIHFTDPNHGWAVGSLGGLYRYSK